MPKKSLSLAQFRRYCEERPIERIVYDADNNMTAHPTLTQLSLAFDSVMVSIAPYMNYVFLNSNAGHMLLPCVERVTVDRRCSSWDVVTIYSRQGGQDIPYIFLFDY